MENVARSGMKGNTRHLLNPVNWLSKGYRNSNLKGLGRAVKALKDGKYYYRIREGMQMRGSEGTKAGLTRIKEKLIGLYNSKMIYQSTENENLCNPLDSGIITTFTTELIS